MIRWQFRRKLMRAINTPFMQRHVTCFRVSILFVFMIICYKLYWATTSGKYSAWSVWSACSLTCGGGTSHRTRTCTNPTPGRLGKACVGDEILTRKCNDIPCPIHGKYTQWGPFDKCDKSCGVGTKTRKRNCTNPAPKYGGRDCEDLGPPEEKHFCNIHPCPIHGGYSSWGEFTNCEMKKGQVCGIGHKVRLRRCDNPVPQNGGLPCQGTNTETVGCEIPCATPSKVSSTNSHTIAKSTYINTTTLRSNIPSLRFKKRHRKSLKRVNNSYSRLNNNKL